MLHEGAVLETAEYGFRISSDVPVGGKQHKVGIYSCSLFVVVSGAYLGNVVKPAAGRLTGDEQQL